MDEIPIGALFGALAFLLILSGFFSGSETSLMSLNRYRLKHLVKSGNRGAKRSQKLLESPDRLIGLILLGNNFVNICASALATIIGMRLYGEAGIAIATGILTFVILIFSEVAPKTIAARHPERFAFPVSLILKPLLVILYPLVWLTNLMANSVLRLCGVPLNKNNSDTLSREELRTVVNEAGAMIPRRHQAMLLSILDLEKVTVEDIMIPRNEVFAINLKNDEEKIIKQLTNSQHTRILVYDDEINNVTGILHLKNALHKQMRGELTREVIRNITHEPYFVPEGSHLHNVLQEMQHNRLRMGVVVDEYGEMLGLITLEDILEEIVGEFTSDPSAAHNDIHKQDDGSYIIDGGINIRQLNKLMQWDLPTDGPKTLNGLIIEYLEDIPETGTSLRLAGYPIDILKTRGNTVKSALIHPDLRKT